MFIILVSGSVFAAETRLVIGDNGCTVVEKIFEQEFTTATEEVSLSPDTLPLQTVPESVTLQEVSDSPRTKIHSYKFYKKAVTLENDLKKTELKPVWTISASETGTYAFKLTYLVRDLQWRGAYNIFMAPGMDVMKIQGAIAIENFTDGKYIQPQAVIVPARAQTPSYMGVPPGFNMPMTQVSGFSDKDMVILENIGTLEPQSTSNIPLFETVPVSITPFLEYNENSSNYIPHYDAYSPDSKASEVWWCVELPNTKENGLGITLPKGSIRVFRELPQGAFLCSSDTVESVLPDQSLRINLMPESGITVVHQRHQEESPGAIPSNRSSRPPMSYEITVSSILEQAREVRVIIWPGGSLRSGMSVNDASELYKTHENGMLEFRVEATPETEKVIRYKASM